MIWFTWLLQTYSLSCSVRYWKYVLIKLIIKTRLPKRLEKKYMFPQCENNVENKKVSPLLFITIEWYDSHGFYKPIPFRVV